MAVVRRLVVLAALLALPGAATAQVFNDYPVADGRTPSLVYEEARTIAGDEGLPETLSFRLALYGTASANMPLVVQVHEWGGSFGTEEYRANWEPYAYNFVMLYFQYQPSEGNQDDWWFGTRWNGQTHLWAHEAVMAIVHEAIETNLVSSHLPGAAIDPNRVYLFGHSIGGTGAWQLGVRHPEVFAAIHAHAGFARFTPPVGPFQAQFEVDIVGTAAEGIVLAGDNGVLYPSRDYSNLAWWLQNVRDPSWDTPFITMTAGLTDDAVPPASGADLMRPVFDGQKRAFFYNRHPGGHPVDCYLYLNRMWNFRRNLSFLAFTNRSGYGVAPEETGFVNDLYTFSWDPQSILDMPGHYEVQLVGNGTADVTPRRLQQFSVLAGHPYVYWLDVQSGPGTALLADAFGLLTVPAVSGPRRIILEPAASSALLFLDGFERGDVAAWSGRFD